MLILLAGVQNGVISGNTISVIPPTFIYRGSRYAFALPLSALASCAIALLLARLTQVWR
jgi:hypothetical protein